MALHIYGVPMCNMARNLDTSYMVFFIEEVQRIGILFFFNKLT